MELRNISGNGYAEYLESTPLASLCILPGLQEDPTSWPTDDGCQQNEKVVTDQ